MLAPVCAGVISGRQPDFYTRSLDTSFRRYDDYIVVEFWPLAFKLKHCRHIHGFTDSAKKEIERVF